MRLPTPDATCLWGICAKSYDMNFWMQLKLFIDCVIRYHCSLPKKKKKLRISCLFERDVFNTKRGKNIKLTCKRLFTFLKIWNIFCSFYVFDPIQQTSLNSIIPSISQSVFSIKCLSVDKNVANFRLSY